MNEDDARKLGRAFALGLIEALGGAREPLAAAPAAAPTEEPTWLPVGKYARLRGFSRSTVQAWIGEGLPSAPMRRGHRVNVRAADVWIESGGAARSGRHDA